MKPSRFNRLFQAADGAWLLFNSRSTALAELEESDLAFIRTMLTRPESAVCDTPEKIAIREGLIDGRYLVEEDEDEIATIKARTMRDRFRTDSLSLTIAPTLDCNFRCDYCYEEHLRVTMSEAVQQALVSWVAERAGVLREINVCWYGGEPLLPRAYEVVENLSRKFLALAAEHSLHYSGQIVTNGYLLDRKKMESLVELGVNSVQITLDGPPEMHDKRRHLVGGQGTFWRIVSNLEQIVDLAACQVRVNVDQRNSSSALEVARLLEERGLGKKVRLYLAQVTYDGAACGNIQELCYASDHFAQTEVEIYREAARQGLPLRRYPSEIPGAFCTADRVGGYVFAPNGLIFKCWHEVTMNPEASIGHLLDGQLPFQKANEDRWLAWDTFDKSGCRSCDVLPLCHGGCPLEAMQHPDRDRGACEHFKFHLEPLLEIRHLHRLPTAAAAPPRGGMNCP